MTMAEQPGTPAPTRPLRLVPQASAADPGADTDDSPVLGASVVVRMTTPQKAGVAVRGYAAGMLTGPGTALDALRNDRAETFPQHRAYVKSRAWVPEGIEGTRAGTLLAVTGLAYHWLIAVPLKTAAKAAGFAAGKADWAADRPLRFFGLLLPLVIAIVLAVITI